MDSASVVIFIIAAFCLGAVLILMKDTIPSKLKRGMAGTAIAFILFAFFLIVYNLLNFGSTP
ncbi:hypothetical protein PASE110613_09700 [Paenibacillus sediminis]|uniref:Signal transduction histidine kinase n=1 Tax=Paenibacillus sediminis TaxID=664909 RepID=A0ABS4H5E1_9BACL|nr:hypothetical protein [Paenibacillus sediminis]MBP1937760.1 hypothetical protein [Paenibacillus sediminis]